MKEEGAALIDNYEIIETFHEAAEGILYRAIDKSSGNRVLIKKYYPALEWSDEILNEFFNLTSYLRFIEHEYLLSIVDIGKDRGKPYVVFADSDITLLCNHQTGQASHKEIIDFLYNTAEVLDYLHKQEILHGSLSPENIAIDVNGYPLLFDFGLSGVFKKLLLENMDDGFENLAIANLKCTSPEQILGRNPTRASDIYTFGVIAYIFMYGEPPINGRYVPEIALAYFQTGMLRTVKITEAATSNILQLIQKCIQSNPDERFTSFTQVLSNLEQLKSGKRTRLRFKKRFDVSRPPTRLQFRVSPLLASVVVLIGSLFVFYYSNTQAIASTSTLASSVPTATLLTAKPETQTPEPIIATSTNTIADNLSPTPSKAVYKIAFQGEAPYATSKKITVANLANLREISRLGIGKPEKAATTPADTHTAIATSAGVIIFEGTELLKWIDPQSWATSVQFSPDGSILAIGLMNGEIQLWNWQNGTKYPASLLSHTDKINQILFSEGGLIYSASADRSIRVWDLNSSLASEEHITESAKFIAAHSQPVNDIAITKDGRFIVSCSDDQLIRVWDLASEGKLYELGSASFEGAIKGVDIFTDELNDVYYLATGGVAGRLYQWKLVTTTLPAGTLPQLRNDIFPVQKRIWSVEYSQDGNELLVGIDNGESLTYDATQVELEGVDRSFEIPNIEKNLLDALGADFNFSAFSVFVENQVFAINWDGKLTYQENQQIVDPTFDNLDRLDFSNDGTVLAVGGKRGSALVWGLETNQVIYQNFYTMPFGEPLALDGSSIALIVPETTSNRGGNIYQIRNFSGSPTTIDLTETLPNANVGYAKNGTVFIAANLDISKAWDESSGNEVRVTAIDYFGCRITVSESNINDRLIGNSPTGIFQPDDDDQALIDNLCPRTSRFQGILSAFSRNLKLLAFVNANGALEGYDVSTKTTIWKYQVPDAKLVTAIAISPDGSIVALGNTSGMITFFNGETGEMLGEIVGNFGKVQSILFSDDSTKIATAGSDGVSRVFGIVVLQ